MVTVNITKNTVEIDSKFEPSIGMSRQVTAFKMHLDKFNFLKKVERNGDVITKLLNDIEIPEFELSNIAIFKDETISVEYKHVAE